VRAHAERSERGQQAWHGDQARQPARDGERLSVVGGEHVRPRLLEVVRRVEQLGADAAGLEAVVDALAVERVDAAGGVAHEDPVGPGHAGHRAAHRQQGRRREPQIGAE
jgi:hypothetical protein